MIDLFLRFLLLVTRARQVYPTAPLELVIPAVRETVDAEQVEHVPAEIMIAITEHESSWEHDAVSFRSEVNGNRVDMLLRNITIPRALPARTVCGYMQAVAHDPDDCATMIHLDGGMVRGASEIREWLDTCHGDLRCALAGHAGGNAGAAAWRAGRTTQATRFAAYFYAQAVRLGLAPQRKAGT